MRKLFLFLNRNKTKITGMMLVAIGSVQANSALLQSVLTPKQFAWVMVGGGVLVATLGFLNNPKPQDGDQ